MKFAKWPWFGARFESLKKIYYNGTLSDIVFLTKEFIIQCMVFYFKFASKLNGTIISQEKR